MFITNRFARAANGWYSYAQIKRESGEMTRFSPGQAMHLHNLFINNFNSQIMQNNITQSNSKGSSENFLLIILLAIGLFGAYYIYNNSQASTSANTNYTKQMPERNPLAKNVSYDLQVLAQTGEFTIKGAAKVGAELQIQLKDFKEGQKYYLELGNSSAITLEKAETHFTVKRSGSMHVKLLQIKNGAYQTISSTQMRIAKTGKNI